MIRERTEHVRPRTEPEPAPPPPRRERGVEPPWGDAAALLREHPLLAAAGVMLLAFVLVSLTSRRRGRE